MRLNRVVGHLTGLPLLRPLLEIKPNDFFTGKSLKFTCGSRVTRSHLCALLFR